MTFFKRNMIQVTENSNSESKSITYNGGSRPTGVSETHNVSDRSRSALMESQPMHNLPWDGSRKVVVEASIHVCFRTFNDISAIKLKSLFMVLNIVILASSLVQAGFWTFYFPNFLKPSGYKELTKMINRQLAEMNSTMDNFADVQYFWGLMQKAESLESDYPEESACADVFPLYRDLAIEYAYIDFEHFMEPLRQFHDYLVKFRAEYYPEGEKGKTILPRRWEHDLYKKELDLRIEWHSKLTNGPDYKMKREKMVTLWQSVKRGLDTSLPCIYLRYAFRQTAEDINQFALEMNLESMNQSLGMLEVAFKRTKLMESSDESAVNDILEVLKKEERFKIKN